MKRRCLLKVTPRCPSAIFFVGLLGATTTACAFPDQPQTATESAASGPLKSGAQAAPNAPKKKPCQAGVWHHFSEKNNPSVAGHNQSGVWRPFGTNYETSKVSPNATAPRQSFGASRMADLERQMYLLVNDERLDPEAFAETDGRARPLKWNESLASVARAHSRRMIEQGFFNHVDPDGTTLAMRIDEAGIPWWGVGENIAIYETVLGAEAAFMNEPRFRNNHRANILNPSYTEVGIGIVQGPDGSLYITQDFVATSPNRAADRSAP